MDIEAKEKIRRGVWQSLEEKGLAEFPRPCFGRIPNFVGSGTASSRIKELAEFRAARCVFCAPDFVLKRIREIVLEEGKVLAVALPHMVGFVEISERERIREATTIKGFRRFGRPLRSKVELFVQGSVAVDMLGNRLGKGRGYGDQEWAYLSDRGLISSDVKLITIVHEEQIVDDMTQLMGEHDKRVDYILTPSRIIETGEE